MITRSYDHMILSYDPMSIYDEDTTKIRRCDEDTTKMRRRYDEDATKIQRSDDNTKMRRRYEDATMMRYDEDAKIPRRCYHDTRWTPTTMTKQAPRKQHISICIRMCIHILVRSYPPPLNMNVLVFCIIWYHLWCHIW